MAKNSRTETVEIRLTGRTKRDFQELERLTASLAKNIEMANAAAGNLRKLGNVGRLSQGVFGDFGSQAFLTGRGARSNAAATRVGFDGTATGQRLSAQKQELALGKQLLQNVTQREAMERAMMLPIRARKKSYLEIRDIDKLSTMAKEAQLRSEIELARAAKLVVWPKRR